MADYKINVSFGDYKNTMSNLVGDYDKSKARIEGNVIRVRFGAEQSDFQEIEKQVKFLNTIINHKTCKKITCFLLSFF